MLEILHKLLHNITNCLANFQIYRDWCKIIALKSNQSNIHTHTHQCERKKIETNMSQLYAMSMRRKNILYQMIP